MDRVSDRVGGPERPRVKALPGSVAQICQGDEGYGVGSILRLYAECFPDMLFVCMNPGRMHDWLLRNHKRVLLAGDGMPPFVVGGSLRFAPGLLRLDRQARKVASQLVGLLEREGISIAHAHWLSQHIMVGHLRASGIRAVWHIHNNLNRDRLMGLGVVVNHWLARRGADVLVAVSDHIRASWVKSGVNCVTIRNAVRLGAPAARGRLEASAPIRAVIAARLDASKGVHLAIDAVLEARRMGIDVTLDVCGSGPSGDPYIASLKERVAKAGEEGAVRFLGFVTDLRRRHSEYDIGMQCRVDPEPCSVWVCEALADGLPLVASATGGTPELVEDGVSGVLFDPEEPGAVLCALTRVIESRERLRDMAAAAAIRGAEVCSIDRFVSQSTMCYEALLK